MDTGILIQIFLGVLWLIGCAIFVTFMIEFREDMVSHPNYPERKGSSIATAQRTISRRR
jgi:hypothetical protein